MDIPTDETAVFPIGVQPRPAPGERPMLVAAPRLQCVHYGVSFEIDKDGQKCKCLACGTEVSPWFVLDRLMSQESQWMRTRAAYQDEMRRLAERSRTKCRHCGEITRISHA